MDSSLNSLDGEAPKMVQVGMLLLPVDTSNECNTGIVADAAVPYLDHHNQHLGDTKTKTTTNALKKVPSMILLGGSSDEEFSTFDVGFPNTRALPMMKKKTPFNLHKRSVSELPHIITSAAPVSRSHRRSYSCDDYDNESLSDCNQEDPQIGFDFFDDLDNAPPRTNFNPPADPFLSDSYAELVAPVLEKSTFGKSGSYVHLVDLATEDTTACSTKSSQNGDDIMEPISKEANKINAKSHHLKNEESMSSREGKYIWDNPENDNNFFVDSGAEDEKDVTLQELLPHPLAGKSMRRCTSSNALEYAVVG